MLEKIIQASKHPFWDVLISFIKKFKSSKSYWSVSSLILIFTLREAIAWKFGSAIKTFCEEQAKGSDYATLWDIVGFIFDVGGSVDLVLFGTFIFVLLSVVKVFQSENSDSNFKELKALIKLQGGDETDFLRKYFGEDYQIIINNPQTYHNFTTLLKNSNKTPNELIEERKELLKKIQAQSLKNSLQKLVDQAFQELRYQDVRILLDEFIADNQAIGDDLIKAHFQKALTYIEEIEYHKAKAEFEEFIPLGIKDVKILYEYGSLYWKLGEYDKMLDCNSKALTLNIEEFGENHAFVATNYNQIGLVWGSKKKYDKAIEFHNKSLKIRLTTLGKDHPSTAMSYNNIGWVYDSQGKYDKAIEFHNKSLKIRLALLGENHPHIAMSYSNIATVYYKIERYQDAYHFMEKAVKIYEMKLPSTHPHLIQSKKDLETMKKKL